MIINKYLIKTNINTFAHEDNVLQQSAFKIISVMLEKWSSSSNSTAITMNTNLVKKLAGYLPECRIPNSESIL